MDYIFDELDVKRIDLLDLGINGYDYTHEYPQNDKYPIIVDHLLEHESIFFATPVYWYSMSSLMKTMFDRFSDLVTYKKSIGRKLKGKSTFLIAVGAEAILPEGFEVPFRCTSQYLDMKYQGCIYHCTEKEFPITDVLEFRKRIAQILRDTFVRD